MLFRYSALTFNGHRIHYDVDYCREVEGYENLVIHGPLNATLLARFAEQVGGRPLKKFDYRGLKPSILGSELSFNAIPDGEQLVLWVSLPDGSVSMRAEAMF
jgi:3-methylfumaryl-CoA hydratase